MLVGGGRYAIPWALERVVGVRNRELFTLAVVLVLIYVGVNTQRIRRPGAGAGNED